MEQKILNEAQTISTLFKENITTIWDGRSSILEMKDEGYGQWKQMEWIGFYFQFLCSRNLSPPLVIPGENFGKVEFDGAGLIPWDFKTHVINKGNSKIIVNDSEAIKDAIMKYGYVGLIVASGMAEYNDDLQTFKEWHGDLKGGKSKYEKDRIKRGAKSRKRKVSFELNQISFILIDDEILEKCGSFQKGFRNAGGTPRREKVLLDLKDVDEELLLITKF